ncbi:hypothetical protein [Streptomyces coffeae]|uniref:hypothetical protein n=1 Tax=Streptomyces coffeae TaxID=621382 RepID=UPI0027DD8F1F|nr:hypothetical protein [Streptomyces coffeae]
MSGPPDVQDSATLETALTAALRADHLDPRAEQQALAAFRSAAHGSTGARRARTRRCDDWRRPEERRIRRPMRMTFGVAFASLALGGVAVAAIGSADRADTGRGTTHPSTAASDQPGGTASSASSDRPEPTDHPSRAQDTEAHCRAYEQVGKHGKALNATAWQQLVTAAGGQDKVATYCSEQLTRATATPNRTTGAGKPGKGPANADSGATGDTGASGNGTSGTGASGADPGGTHNATGNGQVSGGTGQASGGTGSGKHQ